MPIIGTSLWILNGKNFGLRQTKATFLKINASGFFETDDLQDLKEKLFSQVHSGMSN